MCDGERRLSVRAVKPRGGVAPDPRAYHTLTPAGGRHLVLCGGRAKSSAPPPLEALGVYDVVTKTWVFPGAPPAVRTLKGWHRPARQQGWSSALMIAAFHVCFLVHLLTAQPPPRSFRSFSRYRNVSLLPPASATLLQFECDIHTGDVKLRCQVRWVAVLWPCRKSDSARLMHMPECHCRGSGQRRRAFQQPRRRPLGRLHRGVRRRGDQGQAGRAPRRGKGPLQQRAHAQAQRPGRLVVVSRP